MPGTRANVNFAALYRIFQGAPITETPTWPRWLWLPFVFLPLVTWSKDSAVIVLALAAILVLAHSQSRAAALVGGWRLGLPSAFGLMFFLWALAAVAWSPTHHATDWIKTVIVVALTLLVGRALARIAEPWVSPLGSVVIAATLVLLGLLTVERVTGGFLIGLYRVGQSRDHLFDIMSPGLALLSCLCFPTAALLQHRTGDWRWSAAFVLGCFVLGLTYHMDAAPVAIASAAIAFLIVAVLGARGFVLIVSGIAVITLAWGNAAALAWQHGEHVWLTHIANYNWGYRVEIWNRVHELIADRFWAGYGFDTARLLGHVEKPDVNFLHPHNGLLQVWLELGLIGVLLLLAWVAAATHRFLKRQLPTPVIATAAATVTALSVFWSISFGIWQGWWASTIGLTFCAIVLVTRAAAVPGRNA